MNKILLIICLAISGCAGQPPKLAECKGDFRPVNKLDQKTAAINEMSNKALCLEGVKHG